MVLINNLTIDEINAALLHLQRSQGEIVGGTKGNTINNISVTQQGGGGYTPDFSSAIKNLEKRVDTLDVKTEQNQQNIAGQSKINVTQKDQISDLYNLVNNLRSSQITELFFDEDTRVLTLATTDARYDVPLPSEEVSLTFDSTTNKLVFSMGEQTKEVTLPYINASEKGVANGVATLDATGRVPYSQLPESAMEFKGEWNADTNTPTLKDGTGTNGDFYICNVGGTTNFGTSQNPRTITFYVNDRVIYQGNVAQWKRLPASEVRTVNGQSGDVTLNGTNVNYSAASNSPTLKDKIDTVEGYAKTQSDWGQTNTSAIDFIKNKPSLATVATSGSYNDLSNKPTIPAAQIQSDWTQTDSTKKDFIKNKIPIWITSGSADDNMSPIDSVTNGSMRPITSNAVFNNKYLFVGSRVLSVAGWYKIAEFGFRNRGDVISIDLWSAYFYQQSCSHKIQINYGFEEMQVMDFAQDRNPVIDKIKVCYNSNDNDVKAVYIHYTPNQQNTVWFNINAGTTGITTYNFVTDNLTWRNTIENNLGTGGLYINGQKIG